MNEPLLKKATDIISKHGKKTMFGGVKFNSEHTALMALIEFAKYYDKFEHESKEDKIKDGDDPTRPKCAVCREHFTRCLCLNPSLF
jgi:hypothetical protein